MVTLIAVFGLAAGILGLVAGAVAVAAARSAREKAGAVREAAAKIEALEKNCSGLEERVKALEQAAVALPQQDPAAPAKEEKGAAEPWSDFLAGYQGLMDSFAGGAEDEQACRDFALVHELRFLICLNPSAQVEGKAVPKFVSVSDMAQSTFWAYALPDGTHYAIVPNPLHGYTKELHEKGGMKETFAVNFDGETMKKFVVKLPAIFTAEGGTWLIEQPGIIRKA